MFSRFCIVAKHRRGPLAARPRDGFAEGRAHGAQRTRPNTLLKGASNDTVAALAKEHCAPLSLSRETHADSTRDGAAVRRGAIDSLYEARL